VVWRDWPEKGLKLIWSETRQLKMVKTRHGGGDNSEADESVDTELPHCSSQSKQESLETKESCVNVSA